MKFGMLEIGDHFLKKTDLEAVLIGQTMNLFMCVKTPSIMNEDGLTAFNSFQIHTGRFDHLDNDVEVFKLQ